LNVHFKYILSERSTQTTPKWMARVAVHCVFRPPGTAYFVTSKLGPGHKSILCVGLSWKEICYDSAATVRLSTGEIHWVNHYIMRFGVQAKMNGPTDFQISLSVNFFLLGVN